MLYLCKTVYMVINLLSKILNDSQTVGFEPTLQDGN